MKSRFSLLLVGLLCTVETGFTAPTVLVTVSSQITNPEFGEFRKPMTLRYTIQNQDAKAVVLSVPKNDDRCRVVSFLQAPLASKASAEIQVKCEWQKYSASPGQTFTHAKILVNGVETKIPVNITLYDPEKFTEEKDRCTVREKKINEGKLNCPQGLRKAVKLCFISSAFWDDKFWPVSIGCDSSYQKIRVSNESDISKVLDQTLNESCDIVKEILFQGHGSSGVQIMGDTHLNERTLQSFGNGKYSCMLSDKLNVVFGGCNVGTGCDGRIFMLHAAEALSPDKHVRVLASTQYSNSWQTGVGSASGSMNNKDLVLTHFQGESLWTYSGIGAKGAIPEDFSKVCARDCESEKKFLKNINVSMPIDGDHCGLFLPYLINVLNCNERLMVSTNKEELQLLASEFELRKKCSQFYQEQSNEKISSKSSDSLKKSDEKPVSGEQSTDSPKAKSVR